MKKKGSGFLLRFNRTLIFDIMRKKTPRGSTWRSIVFSASFFFLCSPAVFPYEGADLLSLLYSARFLTLGPSVSSFFSPHSNVLNPASSGAYQLPTIEVSYLGIAGTEDESALSYRGHFINVGNSVATAAGVVSWSARYMQSQYELLKIGNAGAAGISFSKDVYNNLLVGAGIDFSIGYDTALYWTLGLNLGFIHSVNVLPGNRDLQWGIALRNIGYAPSFRPYDSSSTNRAFEAPFILQTGFQLELIDKDPINFEIGADLLIPTFQNLRLTIGSEFSIRRIFSIQAHTTLDLREIIQGAPVSMLPGFGIAFTIHPGTRDNSSTHDWQGDEYRVQSAAKPFAAELWAFGAGVQIPLGRLDRDPPSIIIRFPGDERGSSSPHSSSMEKPENGEAIYLSPNGDGTQDILSFDLSIQDARYINGYRIIIKDAGGNVIRSMGSQGSGSDDTVFVERLFSIDKNISIPDSFQWNGSDDSGLLVPDGFYFLSVQAWDDNGNLGETDPVALIIDTSAPVVDIRPEEMRGEILFSPNADGNKDSLFIQQSGSTEDLWEGRIIDASGTVIKAFRWEKSPPGPIQWNGENQKGIKVEDGTYSYEIHSADSAGNSTTERLDGIIVNTQTAPVSVTIDKQFFSPNADRIKDTITFSFFAQDAEGVDTWSLRVFSREGNVVKEFTGRESLPEYLVFDGRSSNGKVLPEGAYTAQLRIRFANGNEQESQSQQFILDITPPSCSVKVDQPIFSPNNDGFKETIQLYQVTSQEEAWTGTILNSQGQVVISFNWEVNAEPRLTWDGTDLSDRVQPDGEYSYRLYSVDKAGNTGTSDQVFFNLNSRKAELTLRADFKYFSPNNDGIRDTVAFMPNVDAAAGIETYRFQIYDADNRTIRSVQGIGSAPKELRWDGTNDKGIRVEDGEYRAQMQIKDINGSVGTANAETVTVDTVFPDITAGLDKKIVSPNNDGRKDSLFISQQSSDEQIWEGSILAADGSAVKKYQWTGSVASFNWDCRDDTGDIVPDGIYRYEIAGEDQAGNRSEVVTEVFTVDTSTTDLQLATDLSTFSPNGDGEYEEISISILASQTLGVEKWKLQIVSETTTSSVREFSGTDRFPESIIWDGKDEKNRINDGAYKAVIEVEYEKGNIAKATSDPFMIDVQPPRIEVTAGPLPFSPDGDGTADELLITLTAQDRSSILDWELDIHDPHDELFCSFGGEGSPSQTIRWDGRSKSGELVQAATEYWYFVRVQDIMGNLSESEGVIPIDILQIRTDDALVFTVSSFEFLPNSSRLIQTGEAAAKNNDIIKGIVEIIKQHQAYSIKVVAHAIITQYQDTEAATKQHVEELIPLTEARAVHIKDLLINNGIASERITTQGMGGKDPIVPHGDIQHRWKNERITIILQNRS